MIKLTIQPDQSCPQIIRIGQQLDNEAERIQFDLTDWVARYGAGVPQLKVKRAGDTQPYPVLMTFSDGIATWLITDTETSAAGYGEVQLSYTVDGVLKHTEIMKLFCGRSLVGSVPAPDPYEDWLTELQGLAAETQINAESAQDSAEAAALSEAAAKDSEDAAEASAKDAQDSADAAALSELNAADSADAAADSAEAAAQSAAQSGYMRFEIRDDGCLYMERVNSPVTFYLQDGYLYVEEVA